MSLTYTYNAAYINELGQAYQLFNDVPAPSMSISPFLPSLSSHLISSSFPRSLHLSLPYTSSSFLLSLIFFHCLPLYLTFLCKLSISPIRWFIHAFICLLVFEPSFFPFDIPGTETTASAEYTAYTVRLRCRAHTGVEKIDIEEV